MSYLTEKSGPNYLPDNFDIPDNYNILQISEIHAFEEFTEEQSQAYSREVADQVNNYVETYNIDEIHVMGDTGTFDDVYNFLDQLNPGTEVIIVAGDEDKKDANPPPGEKSDDFTGFYTQINSRQPFDVDIDYQIFDEGFEKQIAGNRVQASHHQRNSKREDTLNSPDTRPDSVLENLFSVEKYTNENTAECLIYSPETNNKAANTNADQGDPELLEDDVIESPPSLRGLDMVVYDHLHMPYPRTVGNTIVLGLGGRKNNHDPGSSKLPSESIHISSFEDGRVHHMHFDAGEDQIFEHQVFQQSDRDVEMFDVEIPEEINPDSGYLPVQERIRREKVPEKAHEIGDDLPEKWTPELEH
ncbi:hypothetical protein [Candidatus Nanohalovita haloferacivicina]|uniref:hypothetical protein n=1 Tax=Candidatus Nanohalovita haloferacivicina TaxID=2978046 RepID=UPI00325FADE7|nr:hypothetical protein HBNXNv_0083 [Candidatus Nanohalobia archaeon BNXNv]